MDVIINNPAAQSVPQVVAPQAVAPQYVAPAPYAQGYGYAQGYPVYGPYRDHGGPGLFGVLLLIVGGAALFRAFRRRQFREWRRRGVGSGGNAGNADSKADPSGDRGGNGWPGFGFFGERGGERGADPALDIARERFARGEIDAEQYEAIKKGLTA